MRWDDNSYFAGDTALLATGKATDALRSVVEYVTRWTKKWCIDLNETNSTHINFTNRQTDYLHIVIDQQRIPHASSVKCLRMTLTVKRRWNTLRRNENLD